jgi:hypothetical protein
MAGTECIGNREIPLPQEGNTERIVGSVFTWKNLIASKPFRPNDLFKKL